MRTFSGAKYGGGIGPIYFRDIECSGNETSLTYCTVNTNINDCTHDNDAGIRCDGGVLSKYFNLVYDTHTLHIIPYLLIVSNVSEYYPDSTPSPGQYQYNPQY